MSQPKSGLQYDELGFLVGLKQTGRDVAKIDRNVEQIISLLERALKEREKPQPQNELPQPKLSALAQALIDAQREAVSSEDLIREQRQSTTAINQLLETVEDLISESARPSNSKAKPKRCKKRISAYLCANSKSPAKTCKRLDFRAKQSAKP